MLKKIIWLKRIKKIDIDEFIKQNEIINNNLYAEKIKKNINPIVSETRNGKTMLLSKSSVCYSRISRFIKKQEARGILSSLDLKTPLRKVPLLGDILL